MPDFGKNAQFFVCSYRQGLHVTKVDFERSSRVAQDCHLSARIHLEKSDRALRHACVLI